jgi:uncharacterized protein (DUF58 family)
VLWPSQRVQVTREGLGYFAAWVLLMGIGLQQQINLILLTAGLAFGPIAGSWFVSAAMLRRLRVARRGTSYAFAGGPLTLDYALDNDRRWTAALAMVVQDGLAPVDRSVPGASGVAPRVFFPRVPAGERARIRWEGACPARGRYKFGAMELATRSPFGLLERRLTVEAPGALIVYPEVGQLSRRWQLRQREATETRRGQRHDRSSQQQEYHGLRDYRSGDSPRWIHWRTTARLGKPMVKEFEQQHDQDLAILLDPWLPRTKVGATQREALEAAIRFAATVCLETCRHSGRRLLLGWTGATPGLRQGPASVKLLHELLEQLAILRPTAEGQLAALFDAVPAATLRDALIVVVSTRPVNLIEESERSARLSGASGRGLAARVIVLDATRGDLADLIEFDGKGRPAPVLAPAEDGERADESSTINGTPAAVAAGGEGARA